MSGVSFFLPIRFNVDDVVHIVLLEQFVANPGTHPFGATSLTEETLNYVTREGLLIDSNQIGGRADRYDETSRVQVRLRRVHRPQKGRLIENCLRFFRTPGSGPMLLQTCHTKRAVFWGCPGTTANAKPIRNNGIVQPFKTLHNALGLLFISNLIGFRISKISWCVGIKIISVETSAIDFNVVKTLC